jgi:uncharacterized membrane protein
MARGVTAPQEYVVVASFESRLAAGQMLASLGREFRKLARKREASALIASANADGSLKLRQSRVLTAGDVTGALMGAGFGLAFGMQGLIGTSKAAKREAHAVRLREGHVGADDSAAHAVLAEAGRHAAIALIRCDAEAMWQKARSQAAECAIRTWSGSLTELLGALDQGSEHDWVRKALGPPAG